MPAESRPPRILAVDDDPLVMRTLERMLSESGCLLLTADTGQAAMVLCAEQRPDVVIVAHPLADMTGHDLLRHVRAIDPHVPVLVISTRETALTAIESMKEGAFDCLSKPLDLPLLEQQITRALEVRRLMRVPVERARAEPQGPLPELVLGHSAVMQSVWKAIGRIAAHDGPALIEGEPGTGKRLVARVLHRHGPRSAGPLISLKCTDFSNQHLEADLFGHEAGVLTGGVSAARAGKIEQAAGGVLLIEEIGALPLAVQSRLIRVIRERTFERVGAAETLAADVGLIATSTQPLARLVEQGAFRPELYYAIGAFTISLPPLRERKDDIPFLVNHFVKQFSQIGRTFDASVARVSADALDLLTAYDWPGNITELQSVVQRALVETGGAIVTCDLLRQALAPRPAAMPVSREAGSGSAIAPAGSDWRTFAARRLAAGTESLYADALEEMERNVVQAVLDHTSGNQARAAKILGVTRGHLRKKIRVLGLTLRSAAQTDAAAEEPPISRPAHIHQPPVSRQRSMTC